MKTLTFSDTLHPETAQVHVDPQTGATTVWGTVIHEIRNDIPIAVAVEEVRQDEEEERLPGEVIITTPTEDNGENTEMPPGGGCFYLEGLLGCSLTLAAVVATFGVELSAAVCYCIAAGMYHLVTVHEIAIFFKAIVMVVVHALLVADAILLTTSLMLTEILGWVAGLVTSIFSPSRCCHAGQAWHLYVRKVCHLTRWAFRNFHEGWELPRRFPVLEFGEQQKQEQADGLPHNESEQAKQPEQEVVAHQVEVTHNHDSQKRMGTDKA